MTRYTVEVDQTLTYKLTIHAETPEEAKETALDRVRFGGQGVMFENFEVEVERVEAASDES